MRKKARGSISHKSKCKCPYQMFSKSKSLICKMDYIFWPSGVYLGTMRSALENESMKFTKVTDYRRKAVCVCVCVCVRARLVAQSCLTLCKPMNCSQPGSSVCRIF